MIGNTRYLVICNAIEPSLEDKLVLTLDLFSPYVIKVASFVWAISSNLTSMQIYDKLNVDFKGHIRLITHFDQCYPADFDLHRFLNESH